MPTTLNRKAVLAALDIVKPALASRSSIPELAHVWLDGHFAYAHNGGLGIKTKLEVPLKCGVQGNLFMALLNQAATEELEFEAVEDALSFKVGRSRIKLNTLPFDRRIWRYPDEADQGGTRNKLKVSKEFIAGLKQVMVLRPSNPQRMEHHAVSIYKVDAELDLYVTDSASMVIVPVKETFTGKDAKIAMPRDLAEQLVSQCASGQVLHVYNCVVPENPPDGFTLEASHYRVDANAKSGTTIYSNVFDTREMLDLPGTADKFVNSKTMPPFKIPEGLSGALERAVLLAGTEEALVTFKASAKSLKLSAKFKTGQIDEEFTLAKAIPKATVSLDAKVLLGVKGADQIALSDRAINFFGAEKNDFTYILAGKDSAATRAATTAPAEEDA